jgi:hypothetical protein
MRNRILPGRHITYRQMRLSYEFTPSRYPGHPGSARSRTYCPPTPDRGTDLIPVSSPVRRARAHCQAICLPCPAAPAIELEFAGKARLRIPASIPAGLAAAVVKALSGAMIPAPLGVRVWLAVGHTDMRRGMNSLALQVQEGLKRDPHAGDLYVFRRNAVT